MTDSIKKTSNISSMTAAFFLAALVLVSTMTAAEAVSNSKFFRQSKFVTTLLSSDSTSLTTIVTNPKTLDAFTKFLGAVTTAYINFEMIPVNEANTFIAVFESLNEAIEIESFTYHGKSLTITGTATGRTEYFRFYRALEATEHFASVNGHQYITVDDNVRFEIECAAEEAFSAFSLVIIVKEP